MAKPVTCFVRCQSRTSTKASSVRPSSTAILLLVVVAACGSGDPGPVIQANRSPQLVKPATDLQLITAHSYSYDVSQAGTAVTDPDGDLLTYQLRVVSGTWESALPPGLSANSKLISGVPTEPGNCEIEVRVDDGAGGLTVFFRFFLHVVENSAPVVANGNMTQLVTAGAPVNYDAAQGGATFSDADGDSLAYSVTVRGDEQGLTVSGTNVSGVLNQIGAVEIAIEASDGYGGVAQNLFLVAAANTELSSVPVLPDTSYVYRDEDLHLPYANRQSSESVFPLSDAQPVDNRTTDAGATLGRVLFYDKRMSVTNTVSCASCHRQSNGFASPQRFDIGVLGVPLTRNSMALGNTRYSNKFAWFSDMRVRDDLRNLMFIPIDSHDELGMAGFEVEHKLQSTSFYPALFAAAFGTSEVTRNRIAAALSQFVQSLISYRSRADLAVNPMTNISPTPETVLDATEIRGLQIFLANCRNCHEVKAGTNIWQANNGLDSIPTDPGTTDPVLRRGETLGVFRAASLRNIAVSGPYMHDGRFDTLRDVIDHYNQGIQDGPYLDGFLRRANGRAVRLNLSKDDKDALEAFLNTFTDDDFLSDPKFSNPFPP